MANLPVGIQLYTVRDKLEEDYVGTIQKVAEIGYEGVELAGHGPLSVGELKNLLGDLGLKPVASHEPIDLLEDSLSSVIDFSKELGLRFVVCPWMPEERRKDAEGWKATAHTLEVAGKELLEQGLILCYHNHSFEFEKFDGKSGFDIFYEAANPELVKAELDVYWIQHGGDDPVETIRRFAGRCPLIHVKDMADDADRSFIEVGEGIIDMPAVFQAAALAGAEWMLVEQDRCSGDSLESAQTSLENLKRLGLAG
jgi:sugar phosphate isomerase/epimerase